jgi:[acyl-carrier-protein] S-malonyltransferase
MGKELAASFPAARQVFEEVDDAVGLHLFRIMCEGPEKTLMQTENAQPALMAYSMALLKALVTEGGVSLEEMCRYVAGHSLGEYTALAAAGSLTLSQTARLLRVRGKAMNEAVPLGRGGMAAVMGLDLETVRDAVRSARAGGVCAAANDNAPGQVVISGDFEAVERAIALCLQRGARRTAMLTVSGPFHSPLMSPAAEKLADALSQSSLRSPAVPLVSNALAGEVTDPSLIRELLVKNLTGTVRWRESVLYMRRKGIRTAIEVGCGRVLSGLAKRIDPALSPVCVGTAQEVETLLSTLKRMGGGPKREQRKGRGPEAPPDALELRVLERTAKLEASEARYRVEAEWRRRLTQRLAGRLEELRRQVSTVLHDDVVQTVVAAKMKIESLLRDPRDKREPDDAKRLKGAAMDLERTVATLRDLSCELPPLDLEQFGLAAKIRSMCDRLQPPWASIDCVLHGLPQTLDRDLELAVFRVAQETITNAIRHSGGDEIRLTLSVRTDPDLMCLRVEDNGCGFSWEEVVSNASSEGPLGLMIVRELAAGVGGELRVDSTPGKGTQVSVMFPLETATIS